MSDVFASLAAGAGAAAAPAKTHLVEFRAGKMLRDGASRTVRADPRRGAVFLNVEDDGLLHFYWRDRASGRVEDDLIVFPEEAEFVKVEQATDGRVYMLAFKSSSQKHFFWMQEPKADGDAALVERTNAVLASPDPLSLRRAVAGASPTSPTAAAGQAQLQQLLAQMGTGTSIHAPRPQSPAGGGAAAGSDAMAQLRGLLAGIQVPQGEPDIDLTSVLTVDHLRPVLQDAAAREALFPHLPEGASHSAAELEDTIRSPQFRQSLQALAYALRSGQLATILASMGLDPSTAGNASGVEALLRAVAASTTGNKQQQQGDDEDRMDTS